MVRERPEVWCPPCLKWGVLPIPLAKVQVRGGGKDPTDRLTEVVSSLNPR